MSGEQWVNMGHAAQEVKVSVSKLSRLAAIGRIKTQKDPRDERVTLVDLVELRAMFPKK